MSEKITLDAIGDAMGDKITRMAAELVLERAETEARLLAMASPVCLREHEVNVLASVLDGVPPLDDLCGLTSEHFFCHDRALAFGALHLGVVNEARLDREGFCRVLRERRFGGLGKLRLEQLLADLDRAPVLIGGRLRDTCRELIAAAELNTLHRRVGALMAAIRAGGTFDGGSVRFEIRSVLGPLNAALKAMEEGL